LWIAVVIIYTPTGRDADKLLAGTSTALHVEAGCCFLEKDGGVRFLAANYKEYSRAVLRKIIKIVATRCHILKQNTRNSISAVTPPQTPLGKLTALPRLPSLI